MLYWKMFCSVVLSLTPATWCLIFVPLGVILVLVLKERGGVSTLGRDSVWKTLGRKWGTIGVFILAVACLLYLTDVLVGYYKTEYNQEFYEVLRQKSSKIGSANVRKSLVRKSAERMDETQLRDMANSYSASLSPEQRLPFLNSFLGSDLKPGVINWGALLAEKNDDPDKLSNFALNTTLPLDEEQRKLLKDEKWALFWASLREDQWVYISKQMFMAQNHESMVDILTNLVTELDSNESVRLAREMINLQYIGSRHLALRLANEAGQPELLWLFNTLVVGISWFRGIGWLALWILIGTTIVLQAGKMSSASRLFPVNRQ